MGNAHEYDHCAAEADHVLIGESPDALYHSAPGTVVILSTIRLLGSCRPLISSGSVLSRISGARQSYHFM